MSMNTTLARPYAKAAFMEAMQHKNIPAWSRLLQLAALMVQDARAIELLKNPRIPPIERLNCLLEICASCLHEGGRNFFKLLAGRNRLILLPEITALFEAYRIEEEKIARVEVISALAINSVDRQRLAQALKKRLQREITLVCEVDEDLLGGVIIKSGDWVLDDSIRGKLARLNTALMT